MSKIGLAQTGSDNGNSKLSEEQVLQMRIDRAAGDTNTEIAKRYNISSKQVGDIVAGKRWSHVGGPLSLPGVSKRGRRIIAENLTRRGRTD